MHRVIYSKLIKIVYKVNAFNIWINKFSKFHKCVGVCLYSYINLNMRLMHGLIFYKGNCNSLCYRINLRMHIDDWYTVWALLSALLIICTRISNELTSTWSWKYSW